MYGHFGASKTGAHTGRSNEQTTIPLEGVPAAEGPWAVGGTPLAGPAVFHMKSLILCRDESLRCRAIWVTGMDLNQKVHS